jgi:hypothetical protein
MRLALLVLAAPAAALGAPCVEPAPPPPPLAQADPALLTWNAQTRFRTYPPAIPLLTDEQLAERRRRLEARNPGFTVELDETGRVVRFLSAQLPCDVRETLEARPITSFSRREDIPRWFVDRARALEQANWDALGYAGPPPESRRVSVRVTFAARSGDGGVEPVAVFTFADPRPIPRAGTPLGDATLLSKVKGCRLEATRRTCAPCAPPGPDGPSSCPCASFVKARRSCDGAIVFQVEDHFVDAEGDRRFYRIATGSPSSRLPQHADAPWNVASDPEVLTRDAITGAPALPLWKVRGSGPIPVSGPVLGTGLVP